MRVCYTKWLGQIQGSVGKLMERTTDAGGSQVNDVWPCFHFAKGLTRPTFVERWDESSRPIHCDQSYENCIKKRLFAGHRYDRSTRPVRSDLTSTVLYIGVSLFHILDSVCIISASPAPSGLHCLKNPHSYDITLFKYFSTERHYLILS